MALFFFDISDGVLEQDFVGCELASIDNARTEALKFAGELLRHHSDGIWDGHDLIVTVRDRHRAPVLAVRTTAVTLVPEE